MAKLPLPFTSTKELLLVLHLIIGINTVTENNIGAHKMRENFNCQIVSVSNFDI